jgi:hypothetical protein
LQNSAPIFWQPFTYPQDLKTQDEACEWGVAGEGKPARNRILLEFQSAEGIRFTEQ